MSPTAPPSWRAVAPNASPLTRAAAAAAVALLVLHAALAWWLRIRSLLSVPDLAVYIALSRSVRDFGYRSIHLLGAPRHVLYPPGWPTALAGVAAVTGERLDVFRAVGVVLSTAALALVFDGVRRAWAPGVALLVLAACATNPLLLSFAGSALSDVPLLFLTVLCAWAAQRGTTGRGWAVLAAASAIAAALTRSAGVAVVGALVLFWVIERRYREAAILAAVAAVVLGGWLAWVVTAPRDSAQVTYAADLTRGYAPRAGEAGAPGGAARIAARFVANARGYLRLFAGTLPLPTRLAAATRATAVVLAAGVCSLVAGGVLFRRWPVAALIALCTGAVLIVFPWVLERFLVPVLPFAIAALIGAAWEAGARFAPRRAPRRVRWLPATALAAVLVATGARADAIAARAGPTCSAAVDSPRCEPPRQQVVRNALRTLATRTPPGAVIGTRYGAIVYYYTGRQTLPMEQVMAPAALAAPPSARRVNYVLVWPRSRVGVPVLDGGTATNCSRLGLEQAWGRDVYLFRVLPPGVSRDSVACGMIPARIRAEHR